MPRCATSTARKGSSPVPSPSAHPGKTWDMQFTQLNRNRIKQIRAVDGEVRGVLVDAEGPPVGQVGGRTLRQRRRAQRASDIRARVSSSARRPSEHKRLGYRTLSKGEATKRLRVAYGHCSCGQEKDADPPLGCRPIEPGRRCPESSKCFEMNKDQGQGRAQA